jgi:hypothetical protein
MGMSKFDELLQRNQERDEALQSVSTCYHRRR